MNQRSSCAPAGLRLKALVKLALLLIAGHTVGISTVVAQNTAADRAALFDYIVQKTSEREAFSPVKNRTLGLNVEREMLRFRDELIAADTDEKLFYALVKISNARKDRHLRVRLVDGGISIADTTGTAQENYPVPGTAVRHAPIRFATDYGTPDQYFVFVADFARDIAAFSGGVRPEVGDRLASVNGRAFSDYVDEIEPYHRYSTVNGFWWQLATWIPQRTYQFPRSFYLERLELELERENGERYTLALPYLPPETISWKGLGTQRYPGFNHVFSTPTYDLHAAEGEPVLLLEWHGFVASLADDVDRLMTYAKQNDLLGHTVIVDATRSRGGSLGAYAVRRLSPRPFKTTFGNLRISDAAEAFVERRLQRSRAGGSSPRPGEIDDGKSPRWLANGRGLLVQDEVGDVWRISVEPGVRPVAITGDLPANHEVWDSRISPDGRYIAYARSMTRGSSIWRVDLGELPGIER